MKRSVLGLATLGLILAASPMANAAVGLTETVYHNTSASVNAAYSFVNSTDGFHYSYPCCQYETISTFLGSDAPAGSPAAMDSTSAEYFSLTASGYIDVLQAGAYTFDLYGDDWAGITLDGAQILASGWCCEVKTTETLTAGYHPFELTFVADGQPNNLSFSLTNADGSASGFQYTTTNLVAGGVPEPLTWTMLILGLGLVGATLRRQRGLAAAAAAA